MQVPRLILVWLLLTCESGGYSARAKASDENPDDVKAFFGEIEKVIGKIMDESRQENTVQAEPNRNLRYLVPESIENRERAEDSLYVHGHKLAQGFNPYPSSFSNPFYNVKETDKNTVLNFEGYQEVIFQPLYECDHYDSSVRHCVYRRQLGTTITLGVQLAESVHRGMRVYWYRCLRKKYFDNIIKEPLNKGFLPWNLNLGGAGNELRISPISDMDLSYNYFLAELVAPRAYRKRNGPSPSIRFEIEPIEIDMGFLYHGEEIVIYARSFMELPRTSVNFLWSLQEMGNYEDHGLPSNMQLNAEKSSVIIKELKTYQDKFLICKAYSNKDFLLARRVFLFRGYGSSRRKSASNHTRPKRDAEDTEQQYEDSNQMTFGDVGNNAPYGIEKTSDISMQPSNFYRRIPEIPEELFYENGRNEVNGRLPRSKDGESSPPQDSVENIMRRFIQQEDRQQIRGIKFSRTRKPRFEDVESETIASCRANSDCNVRAVCTRASLSEQKFCQCLHGFNGNGIFCFDS